MGTFILSSFVPSYITINAFFANFRAAASTLDERHHVCPGGIDIQPVPWPFPSAMYNERAGRCRAATGIHMIMWHKDTRLQHFMSMEKDPTSLSE